MSIVSKVIKWRLKRVHKRLLRRADLAAERMEDIMGRTDEQYRAATTVWKAVWTFIGTSLCAGGAVAAIQLPETWEEFRAAWPALIVPLGLAIWRAVENYRKNRRNDGLPAWQWPWTRAVP